MSYIIFDTRAEAVGYEATCRKGLGLPRKGEHWGGGRHVPMTDDPQSPGWTRAWSDVRVHPDRGEYAVAALDPAAVDDRRLSLAEQTALVDAYAARRTLGATWKRRITS